MADPAEPVRTGPGEPPRDVTAADSPAGPGNDPALAEQGRHDLTGRGPDSGRARHGTSGSEPTPSDRDAGDGTTPNGRGSTGRGQTSRGTGREAQLDRSGLRPGWTTGACAAAAGRAAWTALLTGVFPDPVEIDLPHGRRPAFALTQEQLGEGWTMAAVTKDAGDDPDVTQGAVVRATLRRGEPGSGIVFRAGEGVGAVTRAGLPLAIGEPAINPVPRRYIAANIAAADREAGGSGEPDVLVTVSIDDGETIARRTWNPRIGILGGLSVLGTTGVVVPYSCAAWIASIHEGIDVARATGVQHAAGTTGSSSTATVERLYPGIELLDMGDFAGAVLKYLHDHPIARITLCGGFAKMSKLANGYLDLHSHRTQVDHEHLAELAARAGAGPELVDRVRQSPTAAGAQALCAEAGVPLGDAVAAAAKAEAQAVIDNPRVDVQVICTDRGGAVVGRAGFTGTD
ncbi:cobalt-precorrin-5B (C(1))-methyltransferase [Propionibacterium acidifaciens]|uniref:cobalt-precorrin-5B (C(1))-methyltransferase n=1 Tax=Propionibacterium acidifaciens TaxID=556499 RepID=UPI003618F4F5